MLGKTTSQLITERVLLEAKRMLVNPKYYMTEVAAFLGFNDYAYFSRIFKTNSGENPKDFRKRYIP